MEATIPPCHIPEPASRVCCQLEDLLKRLAGPKRCDMFLVSGRSNAVFCTMVASGVRARLFWTELDPFDFLTEMR